MRSLYLTLVAILVTTSLSAQPWLKNLPAGKSSAELTLFDYQKAFESYWAPFNVDKGTYLENGIQKKAPGWKQFKRWEYQMESVVDRKTGAFPSKSAQQVVREFELNNPATRTPTTASWEPLGPTTSFSGYSGIGRINCVAFHPTDLNTFWVGAAAGGLWRTTDNGASWTCLTDNNGVLAVSDISIPADYATSNTLYIATGDRDGWDNRSIGILKSTDGGNTWNPTALSFTIYEGRMVNRLLMDPTNNDILIAATTIGVYKTYDGGNTWNSQMSPIEFIDMEFRPGNANIVYGSTKNGAIYLSTDGISFGPAVFSDGNARRTELAVSPNQPDWVYALSANGDSGLYGIFKSIDGGTSFNQVFSGDTKNLLTWSSDGSGTGGQGWYDLAMAASPIDANIVLVGGVNSWRTTDGGNSWSIINHWWGDGVQAVHADKHAHAFRSNGDVFECNDGGIYLSSDNGISWADKTNGIMISQMYRLGVSQTEPGDVITGLQDNGTKLNSGNNWFDVRGGDGMECLIDYTDVNIQYSTVYFGAIDRTTNHWQNSTNITPPDDGAWVTPYIIDPNNPNILYGGYNEVWQTLDRGDNWTQISSIDLPGQLRSMAMAPSDSRTLYIADYGQLWKTTDTGGTWTNITGTLPSGSATIEYITVKHDDPNTLWVAMSGYSTPGVYESVDGGTTWTNISGGLPPIPAYAVVQNQQVALEVELYLGTELGVYYKKGNNDWVPYNTGLPNVKIGEIEIFYAPNPGESRLRAASYGRGLWETPIEYTATPMVYISATTTQKNTSSVAPDQINQEIIKVEVFTNGNLSPFSASSFTFNTDGSTAPATDITNAKLFFTGTTNAFSTATPFGATVSSPDGSFTFEGSQLLGDGKNNFWLTYDIPADAVIGHVLDAQCTALVVESPRTPAVTDPAGSRTISYDFCDAGAAELTYEYISRVTIGAIDNKSGKNPGGYADFSAQIVDMVPGISMDIVVENGVPYFADEVLLWADWNIDGDFEDAGEFILNTGPSGEIIFNASFAPPLSATIGTTRLRVRLHDSQNGPLAQACGFSQWGEVEDYSIRVSEAGPCNALSYLSYKAESIPGVYTSLGNEGSVIVTPEFDNANSAPQEIGFAFNYNCNTFTQFVLNTNGFIKLGDTPPSATDLFFEDARSSTGGIFNTNDPADANLISPLNLDLTGGSGAPEYRVHTSGKAPYRICTIQYQDVREANTDPIPQYDNMQFQIRLHETSNIIEFVYGDWTESGNDDDFRAVACGLKGSTRADNQLLIVGKTTEQSWAEVTFSNANYLTASPIYYAKPPVSPKPDAGRTLRFLPLFNNDLSVKEIYALGEASVYYSSPQIMRVHIENTGLLDRENIPVTLTITGANTGEETTIVAGLGQSDYYDLLLPAFEPGSTGLTTFEITLPDDENPANNTLTWQQNTNEFECAYASGPAPSQPLGVAQNESFIFQAKYHITGTAAVRGVKAYIPYDITNIGQTIYGVVLNSGGTIMAQSEPYIIEEQAMGTWHTFDIAEPIVFRDQDYFVGFAATAADNIYYPLGVQSEDPLRPETFYVSDLTGNNTQPYTPANRLMIGAVLAPTEPVAGIAGPDFVLCSGWTAGIAVQEYSGFIQWQESPDGNTNWMNVSSGSGANTSTYITPPLATTTYYRAEITQPTFAPVYTNSVYIIVMPAPGDAGLISGDTTACQGDEVTYTVEDIENATDYLWTLPDGTSGSSNTNSITVTFNNPISGSISVAGAGQGCLGSASSIPVTVQATPVTPVITNDLGEQSLHSDAPDGNQWYDQNGPIIGATGQDYFADADGNYYVIVTENGCSSLPSNILNVFISALKDVDRNLLVHLYPNPVSYELFIETPGISSLMHYEIHNALGVVTGSGEFSERIIMETSRLAAGLYWVHIQGGGFAAIRKFVKE